ncbi:MAG TPA: ABC transporter ATP-binding protein [bacterium]|nr:ABC transporter ATP-binding protein [bacterium]
MANPGLTNSIRRILAYVKPYRGAMVFAVFCAGVSSAAGTSPVLLLKKFLEAVLTTHDAGSLGRLAIATAALTIAGATGTFGQNYVLRSVAYRVVQDLRNDLVRHYQFLSLDFLQSQKVGDLTSRVVADTAIIQSSVQATVDLFSEPLKLIFLAGYAVWLSPKLVMFFAGALPVVIVVIRSLNSALRRYARKTQSGLGTAAGLVSESLSGAREVRSFGLEAQQMQRFDREHGAALREAIKGARAGEAGPLLVMFIAAIASGFMVWVGGRMVIRGELPMPNLVAFIVAAGMCYDPIKKVTRVYNSFAQIAGAADRIFAMLDAKPTVVDSGTKEAPRDLASLEFDEVSFSYGPERKVLDTIEFEAKRGEVVALVGESGAGKTTMISLVPRFYDVKEGALRINGTDVREFTLKSLRERIALVGQETFLFNDTVRDNIRLGRLDATDAEIEDAAKAAYAHAFIERLPQGYDTMLGERGMGLSGGQRQRIAIARAILRGAPILLLDEATSALDSESEQEVQMALERLMKDKLTLVVAHRLSTVKNADRIVVFSRGKIVEVGAHNDLIARAGEYRRLHDLQFR